MTNHNAASAKTKLLPHAEAQQKILRLLATAKPGGYQTRYEDCRHAVSCAYEALNQDAAGADPLPPDPEDMNDGRAQWAGAALRQFQSVTGADLDDALADLLGDLMHWCDRNAVDFDDELSRARMHYEAETPPEDTTAAAAEEPARDDAPPEAAPSGHAAASPIKTYRAEFFTPADFAVRDFQAETPQRALELARQFYEDDIGELDFRSYDDNAGLDQIQIWDSKHGTLVTWESDNYRLRRAAPELLKQAVRVLAMLPHYGIYNELGMPELRAAVFQAVGIEHDRFDADGFEAALSKVKTGGGDAS